MWQPGQGHHILSHWQDTAEITCEYGQILRFLRVFLVTEYWLPARIETGTRDSTGGRS